jgi:hypothetical protein
MKNGPCHGVAEMVDADMRALGNDSGGEDVDAQPRETFLGMEPLEDTQPDPKPEDDTHDIDLPPSQRTMPMTYEELPATQQEDDAHDIDLPPAATQPEDDAHDIDLPPAAIQPEDDAHDTDLPPADDAHDIDLFTSMMEAELEAEDS